MFGLWPRSATATLAELLFCNPVDCHRRLHVATHGATFSSVNDDRED